MRIIRRMFAVLIVSACAVMYFGGFVFAEHDAYGTHGKDGYVHSPWPVLVMISGLLAAMATIGFVYGLWTCKK